MAANGKLLVSGLQSITTGHFPPSSRVPGVRCLAAAAATMRPTFGLPVKNTAIYFNSESDSNDARTYCGPTEDPTGKQSRVFRH